MEKDKERSVHVKRGKPSWREMETHLNRGTREKELFLLHKEGSKGRIGI